MPPRAMPIVPKPMLRSPFLATNIGPPAGLSGSGIPEEEGLGDLDVLDRHANNTDDPHPKHGARTTGVDRHRDATNIAQANRRRKGGREELGSG